MIATISIFAESYNDVWFFAIDTFAESCNDNSNTFAIKTFPFNLHKNTLQTHQFLNPRLKATHRNNKYYDLNALCIVLKA